MVILFTVSCNKGQNRKVIRSFASFEILNDELLSNSLGGRDLYILENNIIWYNLSSSKDFLHIINKKDGEKVKSVGKIGYKVNEYTSPYINKIVWNNRLFIYDLIGKTKQYFTVDSITEKSDGFINLTKEDSIIRAKGYTMRLEDNLYIDYNTKRNALSPYKLYSNGIEKNFGEYILKNEKEHFYPTILYNPNKKLLMIGSGPLNYLCCYKKEGDDFKLIWENRENYMYGKHNGKIVFDNSRTGMYGMTITKDFIVTIQRDYDNDRTSETAVLKDIGLLPQTLFVYNYNGKLLKIINYRVPIKCITGELKTNMIYAIYDYPNFKIGASLIN